MKGAGESFPRGGLRAWGSGEARVAPSMPDRVGPFFCARSPLGYRQDPWLSILFCIFVALDTSKIWLAWIKRQAKGDSAREVKVARKIITNPVCSSI
jgi:hypothetical protein